MKLPKRYITDTSQSADKHRTRAFASTTNTHGRPDYSWVAQLLKGTHDILWPSEPVTSASPSLLTGLALGISEHLIDNLMEWERKFESADLEGHKQFLQKAGLPTCDRPLEATAWENGFVPEAAGLPTDQLELTNPTKLTSIGIYGLQAKTTNCHW